MSISLGPQGSTPHGDILDAGIAEAVAVLQAAGVETFESCEGGPGHAFHEPTIRFHGHREAGWHALAAAMAAGLPVSALRRYWVMIDGEASGPKWEIVFYRTAPPPGA